MANGVLMRLNPNSWDQDFTFTLSNADADSVVASGTYAAGYVPLNGALAVKTVAQLPVVGAIALASTGNLSAINFVITGVDINGNALTETLAGPNNNSVNSALSTYWRITSIIPSATSVSTINIGVSGSATAITNAGVVTIATPINIVNSIFGSDTQIDFANPAYLAETSAGDESVNTLTVYGIDVNGRTLTKTMLGPNATAANLATTFATILWISQSDINAAAITIGNAALAYSPWIVWDRSRPYWQSEIGVQLSGTATYSVQHCLGLSLDNDNELIQTDSILSAQTASGTTYLYNENYQASRVILSAFTSGTVRMITSQVANGYSASKSTYMGA